MVGGVVRWGSAYEVATLFRYVKRGITTRPTDAPNRRRAKDGLPRGDGRAGEAAVDYCRPAVG